MNSPPMTPSVTGSTTRAMGRRRARPRTSGRSVLIVTEPDDAHAAMVARTLRHEHGIEPRYLYLGEFPTKMTGWFSCDSPSGPMFKTDSESIPLERIRSVWWRRPEHSWIPPDRNAFEHDFMRVECDHFVQGMLWSIECLWVNDPFRQHLAGRKLVQLRHAQKAGLAVPRTLVTNDPEKARDFVEGLATRAIFKRTGTSPGPISKTTFVTNQVIKRLHTIRSAPTTFQEYIEPRADVRVIWIDGSYWATAIDTPSSTTPEDSRFDYSVQFSSYTLPPTDADALSRFMQGLGLVWGAIDMRVALDGTHYFLEVNPAGQFAYLEKATGAPLTSALASLLAEGPGDPAVRTQ